MKNKGHYKAFTLIELLVVISIIGMLASITIVSVNGARARARDAKRMNDLKIISDALAVYYLDNNTYPISSKYPTSKVYTKTDCGKNGVINYSVGADNVFMCSDYPLKMNDNVYLNKIPHNPSEPVRFYTYDDKPYRYPIDGIPKPPCVSSHLESHNSVSMDYFFCQSGNCKYVTNDPFGEEYKKFCR